MFDALVELNANADEKDVTVRMFKSLILCQAALFDDLRLKLHIISVISGNNARTGCIKFQMK